MASPPPQGHELAMTESEDSDAGTLDHSHTACASRRGSQPVWQHRGSFEATCPCLDVPVLHRFEEVVAAPLFCPSGANNRSENLRCSCPLFGGARCAAHGRRAGSRFPSAAHRRVGRPCSRRFFFPEAEKEEEAKMDRIEALILEGLAVTCSASECCVDCLFAGFSWERTSGIVFHIHLEEW